MSKREIPAAVKALLSPTEPDGLGPDYLESLVDAFEQRRSSFARDILQWFSEEDISPAQAVRSRAALLDMLLAFRPNDMRAVLEQMQRDDEDYGRASALLLYGHERGLWRLSENGVAEARKLGSDDPDPVVPPVIAQPLTFNDLGPPAAKSKPEKQTSATSRKRWILIRRVLDARYRSNVVLSNPSSTSHARLAVTQEWVVALDAAGMGDILPADFRSLLAVATRKLEKEKVQ